MPKPTVQVLSFYNNGYNGGLTVRVTSKSKDLTFDVDGADIVLSNRKMGSMLFSITSMDDEFFAWDEDSTADAIARGDLDQDGEMTAQGDARFTAERTDSLNDFAQPEENYEGLNDLILEVFNTLDAD